jgi:hypothetical protein
MGRFIATFTPGCFLPLLANDLQTPNCNQWLTAVPKSDLQNQSEARHLFPQVIRVSPG